jgi:gliding motility-associated-like protein
MFGLYVPNAFSPNRDGRNDRFRPLIYGEVTYYSLQIFNRFGQRIFSTTNPSSSWDGLVNGIEQNSGTYLFNIQYQLNGQSMMQQKGSFLLIR